jgi:hypothetical protein
VTARLGRVNEKLAAVDTPDELKDDYAALRKQLDVVHDDLADVAGAARAHQADAARSASEKTVRDSARIKVLANRVRKAVGLKTSP